MSEMTEQEFWSQILLRMDRLDSLCCVLMIAGCCIAAGMAFQICLYAARNKGFWGCVAFFLLGASPAFAAATSANFNVNGLVVGYGFGKSANVQYGNAQGTIYFEFDAANSNVTVTAEQAFQDALAFWAAQPNKPYEQMKYAITAATYRAGLATPNCPIVWETLTAVGISESVGQGIASDYGCQWPPPCPAYDEGLVGLNCCRDGQYGSTYYVFTDSNGCSSLRCTLGNCHPCPPPPGGTPPEGQLCSCADGQSGGLTLFTYDANGCVSGSTCDGCEPCPEVNEALMGAACTMSDGNPGIYAVRNGPDGCPVLECTYDEHNCDADSNRDGIPDYLAGNPLASALADDPCTCSDRSVGKVEMVNNADGCPVPKCSCEEDECKAGDADGDGCCDDEDPDPEDEHVNCEDCTSKLADKLSTLKASLVSKIILPSSIGAQKSWEFNVNFGETAEPGIAAFGVRFGGDLTAGNFWLGQPSGGVRPDQGEIFTTALQYRALVRSILGSCCYCAFVYAVLAALFNPAR